MYVAVALIGVCNEGSPTGFFFLGVRTSNDIFAGSNIVMRCGLAISGVSSDIGVLGEGGVGERSDPDTSKSIMSSARLISKGDGNCMRSGAPISGLRSDTVVATELSVADRFLVGVAERSASSSRLMS